MGAPLRTSVLHDGLHDQTADCLVVHRHDNHKTDRYPIGILLDRASFGTLLHLFIIKELLINNQPWL